MKRLNKQKLIISLGLGLVLATPLAAYAATSEAPAAQAIRAFCCQAVGVSTDNGNASTTAVTIDNSTPQSGNSCCKPQANTNANSCCNPNNIKNGQTTNN